MEEVENNMNTLGIGSKASAVLTIIALGLLTDIFFIQQSYDLVTFSIFGLYALTAIFCGLSSRVTFLLCLPILAVAFFAFVFYGPLVIAEKAAVWFVLFFFAGIIQRYRE